MKSANPCNDSQPRGDNEPPEFQKKCYNHGSHRSPLKEEHLECLGDVFKTIIRDDGDDPMDLCLHCYVDEIEFGKRQEFLEKILGSDFEENHNLCYVEDEFYMKMLPPERHKFFIAMFKRLKNREIKLRETSEFLEKNKYTESLADFFDEERHFVDSIIYVLIKILSGQESQVRAEKELECLKNPEKHLCNCPNFCQVHIDRGCDD